jgi:hypothetical protein
MEDFVTFELAKKLKEKGFTCELPFAMYNELGKFYLLTTSAPYYVNSSGSKYREYYGYDDFDECDFIAPTIYQVLKWLREEKKLHIIIPASFDRDYWWEVRDFNRKLSEYSISELGTYEEAAIDGIKYLLDNLI